MEFVWGKYLRGKVEELVFFHDTLQSSFIYSINIYYKVWQFLELHIGTSKG